ncbi:MAG: hypothetical protein NXI21_11230 [Alphaproteobacteria bacterium]|nr:hypothetical protein [Alphaproteobacteria bacterium]
MDEQAEAAGAALERALAALETGDVDSAVGEAEQALPVPGLTSAAVHLLGLVAARLDEPRRMLDLFRHAHELDPACREHADALAIAHARLGRLTDSLFYGKLAVALTPHPLVRGLLPAWFGTFEQSFAGIREPRYREHADLLAGLGNLDQALEMYRRAAESLENDPEPWRFYIDRLLEAGRPLDALSALKSLDAVGGADPGDRARVAEALARAGRREEAAAIHEEIIESGRLDAAALSRMIRTTATALGAPADALAGWERSYAELFPPAADADQPSAAVDTGALKIGFVTGRFTDHGGFDFLWPLLTAYGFPRMLVYVYATNPVDDPIARRIQGAVSSWVDAWEIDDLTLNTIIRNDGVHILIDLDAHGPAARPQLFLRRPAPVQVRLAASAESAAAAGFDAVIGDAWLHPPEADGAAESETDAAPVLRVEGGLFRLPLIEPPADLADPFDRPVLSVSVTLAGLDQAVVAALAEACRAHPDLKLCFSADRLGGIAAVQELARLFAGTPVEGRYAVIEPGLAAAPDGLARGGALVELEPCWTKALAAALTRRVPVFAVCEARPEARAAASLLGGVGLTDHVFDEPAAAVAEAAAAAAPGAAGEAARAAFGPRLEAASGRRSIEDWGAAVGNVFAGLYRRFGQAGASPS